jgi:hypothetical protein
MITWRTGIRKERGIRNCTAITQNTDTEYTEHRCRHIKYKERGSGIALGWLTASLKHTGIAHDAAQDTDTYTEIQNTCALKQNTGCVHREKEARDCTKITQNTVLQLQGNRDCTMVIKARCCIHLHSTCSDETHMRRIQTVYAVMKHTCGEYTQNKKYTKRTCTCVCTYTTHRKQAYRHMSTHSYMRTHSEQKERGNREPTMTTQMYWAHRNRY